MHHSAQRALFGNYGWSAILCLTSVFALTASAKAATRCVNPHGTSGCFKTISAAVSAASPGDTINVAPGTYAEDVLIGKSLSLLGEDSEHTIISAKGLANGIYIDGLDTPGLADIVISGFTVQDANFEGILVQNASAVTLWGNVVSHNDLGLQVSNALCPGQPAFETSESDDCGEGIHLMGVDHSTLAQNLVQGNSGGILVTDETAPSHDNVITRNVSRDNPYDCGITIASHPGYVKTGTPPLAFGIYHNTISDNESSHNGFGTPGGGAGIGLFAPGPGNVNIENSVVHNRLTDNALPGVAIHNHAYLTFPGHPPNPDVNDNAIVGNYIAGNGADSDLPTTVPTGIAILGTTPITGLVITGNVIRDESIDVAVNSASALDLHLNDFDGHLVGIANVNPAGTINATENWWGCAHGPGVSACSSITGGASVVFTPWLTQPFNNEH
jgi:nitrous oxidase accessory protein NosD